jgi:hypothetical protein
MPTTLAGAIDAFMAAQKRIVGFDAPPRWGPGFNPYERVMKYPLEIGGEQSGPQLMVVCFPREPGVKFRLGILVPATLVCRLDFTDEAHPNSADAVRAGTVPPIVIGPHYHTWPLNRRFCRGAAGPARLHDAEPFAAAGSFDATLRWFCADTNIEPLPPGHLIGLPGLDLLV